HFCRVTPDEVVRVSRRNAIHFTEIKRRRDLSRAVLTIPERFCQFLQDRQRPPGDLAGGLMRIRSSVSGTQIADHLLLSTRWTASCNVTRRASRKERLSSAWKIGVQIKDLIAGARDGHV